MTTYDLIIIGGGAHGSSAAFHAARRGAKVLLLEQFEFDHGRGSSHGASRIIRYSYDHPVYVELARHAYAGWAALEAESGETLYQQVGGVDISRRGEPMFEGMLSSLTEMKIPFELLKADETMRRFPQFRLTDDMLALYQADTGVLAASRCVLAHLRLAHQYGATFLDNATVTHLAPHRSGFSVQTTAETYHTDKVILAAGAWANTLLGQLDFHLPLRPIRCQENYFEPLKPEIFAAENFPVFIAHFPEAYGYMPYGIPSFNDSGLKIALHGGPDFDPTSPERTPDPTVVETVLRFAQDMLPEANGQLLSSRLCLYTMTPDEHFVIDHHPANKNVVIGAACSGHGFKFSNIIGEMLVDLALDGATQYDISLFSATRFGAQKG
jgi:sarcosine oxidase